MNILLTTLCRNPNGMKLSKIGGCVGSYCQNEERAGVELFSELTGSKSLDIIQNLLVSFSSVLYLCFFLWVGFNLLSCCHHISNIALSSPGLYPYDLITYEKPN